MTKVETEAYRTVLKQAREQFKAASDRLTTLQYEQYELENEISRLRRTITALASMCSENPYVDELGITEAVRDVMAEQRTLVTTADVMQKLDGIGFDLKSQKNAQASVHAVLQRLFVRGKGEVERVEDEGKTKWKGPKFDPEAITDDDIPF